MMPPTSQEAKMLHVLKQSVTRRQKTPPSRGVGARFLWALLAGVLCPGPKGKLLGKLVTAGLTVLAAHVGREAIAQNNAERRRETEPDPFKECIRALMAANPAQNDGRSVVNTLLGALQGQRRLAKEDAEDIAYSALVDICVRHSSTPYQALGNAYYRAGVNRANKFYRRYRQRYLSCEAVEDLAESCRLAQPWARPDANARLHAEVEVTRRSLCNISDVELQVLVARGIEESSFAEVGKKLGLTTDQAHDTYHNTLRRVQAQVKTACPAD
jgi:DNA-directed RNA polymerase specialized sigma24 family protein